jgi:hypothetical protein
MTSTLMMETELVADDINLDNRDRATLQNFGFLPNIDATDHRREFYSSYCTC